MLAKIDRAVYRAERVLAGSLFLFMVVVMFTNVTREIYVRPEGRLSALLLVILRGLGMDADPATIHGPVSSVMNVVIAFLLAYAALRTMRREPQMPRGRALAWAAVAAAGFFAYVTFVLWFFPSGLVWGDHVSLACMLWVGFLGASIATYEKRHLALEMGEKIWPEGLRPIVKAIAMLCTTALCAFLLYLAWLSLKDHYKTWSQNHLIPAERLSDTFIPIWFVLLIFPYTFLVMSLRFVGQAVGAFRPEPEAAAGEGQPS